MPLLFAVSLALVMKVLFVCLGNICRSPLAQVIFEQAVRDSGDSSLFFADSAGTAGYHIGDLSDRRSRDCARRHGTEIVHTGRQVSVRDFDDFDLILAMDHENFRALQRLAPHNSAKRKVALLRDWDPVGPGDVPDPYYGEESDFESVWHLCERSMPGLLDWMRKRKSS